MDERGFDRWVSGQLRDLVATVPLRRVRNLVEAFAVEHPELSEVEFHFLEEGGGPARFQVLLAIRGVEPLEFHAPLGIPEAHLRVILTSGLETLRERSTGGSGLPSRIPR